MKWIETGLQTVGAQTVSRWWTYWKETSVLSLFRPSFWPTAARTAGRQSVSTFLHSGFFGFFCLLSLSQPFLLTLLYLTDIFRWSCQRGLHFSTPNFNVLDRTQPVSNEIPRFPSRAFTHRRRSRREAAKGSSFIFFSVKLGTFFKGQHVVRHLAQQYTQGTSGGWIPVSCCHTQI